MAVRIQVHEAGGALRFSAIAAKNVPHSAFRVINEGRGAWRSAFSALSGRGYRLLGLNGYQEGKRDQYIGCFATGEHPATGALVGIPSVEFAQAVQFLREKKLRPLNLAGFRNGATALLTVVFCPDDGTTWEAWPALTEEQYESNLKEGRAKGYRPLDASCYPTKDGDRYTLLLVKDAPKIEWAEKHGLTPEAFEKEACRWKCEGYRPLVVTGSPAGKASRYLGVWVKDGLAEPLGPPRKK
jgi:hypothetical protein